ncbi:transposase [Leptospira kirschneri]|uniref:transposase n=1 Tax=Leptospira kirschneri TaxID=29507 RepID=UPI00398AA7D6
MNARLDAIVDPVTLAKYYREWRDLKGTGTKLERGEIVREVCKHFGIDSVSTVYKYFNRLLTGESVFNATKPKARGGVVLSSRREKRYKLLRKIATLKIATETNSKIKNASTKEAMRICVEEGFLRAEDLPHRSTIDRDLGKYGLRMRDFRKAHTAVQLYADFAGEWYIVDATPLDQHYLRLDNKFKYRKDLSQKDKHLSEILHREGLRKIQLFFAVDLYSGAWFCKAYAPEGGGESVAIWLDFWNELILAKPDIPIQGVCFNAYGDQGNGLKSNEAKAYFNRLGTNIVTHRPNMPSAKGLVEGRISASKRSHEALLKGLEDEYLDLNLLNEHYRQWQIYHNTVSGAYSKFCDSTNKKPLRSVNADDVRNARLAFNSRKVDAYGCISIKWTSKSTTEYYFVGRDIARGTDLNVYRDITGKVIALDPRTGRRYECDQRGKQRRKMGTFHNDHDYDWNETPEEKVRKEIRKIAKDTTFSFESTLPPKIDIPEWIGKTRPHFVPDPNFPTEYASVGDAICALEEIAGEIEEDLLPAIASSLNLILESNGRLVYSDLRKFADIIRGEEG